MERSKKRHHSASDSVGAKILEGLREFTEALENGEPITKRFTCRTVVLDLAPRQYGPAEVKAAREALGASQSIFAQFLGVSAKSVHAWEQGINAPSDIARRFMDEIRRNPDFWRGRLRESIKVKQGVGSRRV